MGTYGSVALQSNGQWVYTASSAHNEFVGGTNYSDVFTVTSTDGTTSTITVNILGTNDAAVISTATVNLTETNSVLAASGILSISDVDSAATFVAGTISLSTYGSIALQANGQWQYTASTPTTSSWAARPTATSSPSPAPTARPAPSRSTSSAPTTPPSSAPQPST
ncbi:VCBS domain-containing protein [Massilia sp. H-1]|nr:VCBS domain-containing protein [Massilia sp. H-1]